MMKRRIFLWMGLGIFFASLGLCREGLAQKTYQVRQGDTLYGISAREGTTPEAIRRANHLKGNNIQIRQTLRIPTVNSGDSARKSSPSRVEIHVVKKGETLSRIAAKRGLTVSDLREINGLRDSKLRIGQRLTLRKEAVSPQAVAGRPLRDDAVSEADLDEEEDDGPLGEEAWAEVEKRKQDNRALLGKWTNPDEPKLLVKVAMGFLGAPYRLGGSSVTGIDCSGFVKKIYEIFNIDLPRTAFEQSHVGMRVARGELAEGDLIFFNTRRAFGHVGIYIGNNQFVHAASRKRGVRVDSLSEPYYKKRYVHAVRLKALDEGL